MPFRYIVSWYVRYPSLHKKLQKKNFLHNIFVGWKIWFEISRRIFFFKFFNEDSLVLLVLKRRRKMLNARILIVFGLVSCGVFARNADGNREFQFLKETSNKKHGGSMLMEIAKELVQRSSTSSQVRWYKKFIERIYKKVDSSEIVR